MKIKIFTFKTKMRKQCHSYINVSALSYFWSFGSLAKFFLKLRRVLEVYSVRLNMLSFLEAFLRIYILFKKINRCCFVNVST
jgi:hypothetical protein